MRSRVGRQRIMERQSGMRVAVTKRKWGMHMMRRSIRIVLGLVLTAAIVMAVLLFTVDPNDFKPQIIKAVRDNTGRELVISGDLGLELFPHLHVSTGTLELGNRQGFSGPFLTLRSANLKARLLPLLASRLDVVAIEIEGLSLFLDRDASGQGNWMDLAAAPRQKAESGSASPLKRDRRVPVLAGLIVDGLEISDARIVWNDLRSGENFEVSGISLDVSDFAFGKPFDVDTHAQASRGGVTGELDFSTRAVLELERLTLENLDMKAVLSGNALPGSPETVTLSADHLATDGRIDNGRMRGLGLNIRFSAQKNASSELGGVVEAGSFNPKDACRRLGLSLPRFKDPLALESVAFTCAWSVSGERLDVSDVLLAVDDSSIKGGVTVRGSADPFVDLDLHLDAVNLDRYRILPEAGDPQPASGVSDNAFHLPVALMRTLNFNATMAADSLAVSNLDLSDTHLSITARDGLFSFRDIASKLYNGRLHGSASLDVRSNIPAYSWDHALDGLELGPFLLALHGRESLSGTMRSSASLTTFGMTERELRRNLNGKLDFKVADGAISGTNVSQLLRDGIRKLKGQSPGPVEAPRTLFSVLSASGTVTSGVETTPDLYLLAPRFRVTGSGQTDLVTEVLDFRLVIELEGSQGRFDEGALGLGSVPVRVSGPVREPTISPDMDAILRDLGLRGGQAVQDVLKGVGSGLNKGVEGLKNLFK